MVADDHRYRYSVAWIDLIASGSQLGRAALTRGNHATLDDLHRRQPAFGGEPARRSIRPSFPDVPPGVPNVLQPSRRPRRSTRSGTARRRRCTRGTETITGVLPPARHGRTVEPAVRPARLPAVPVRRAVRRRSRRCARSWPRSPRAAMPSFVTVLKRFGAESGGLLSFPQPGWTLTVDFPASPARLAGLLEELDRLVLDAGGRHYLAKDATRRAGRHPRRLPATRRVEGGPLAVRSRRSCGRATRRAASTSSEPAKI